MKISPKVGTKSSSIIDAGGDTAQAVVTNVSDVTIWINPNVGSARIPVSADDRGPCFDLGPGRSFTWSGTGTVTAIAERAAEVSIELI